MSLTRPRVLGLIGIAGSVVWLALNTVLSPDWGPPGSGNYLGYETINRLWAPCFAAMLTGFAGLFARYPLAGRLGAVARALVVAGLLAMIAGNVAEFWFFTNQAYGELNARSFAWIGVLLGMLSLLIGCLLSGLAGWRGRIWPRGISLMFLLALPVTLLLMFAAQSIMFIMLPLIGVLAGGLAFDGLRDRQLAALT